MYSAPCPQQDFLSTSPTSFGNAATVLLLKFAEAPWWSLDVAGSTYVLVIAQKLRHSSSQVPDAYWVLRRFSESQLRFPSPEFSGLKHLVWFHDFSWFVFLALMLLRATSLIILLIAVKRPFSFRKWPFPHEEAFLGSLRPLIHYSCIFSYSWMPDSKTSQLMPIPASPEHLLDFWHHSAGQAYRLCCRCVLLDILGLEF